MPLGWIDVKDLSINTLLLLEREQIGWLPGWLPEKPLAIVFHQYPYIAWYFTHKNPQVQAWVQQVKEQLDNTDLSAGAVYQAEQTILNNMQDLIIYALEPNIYDQLDFLNWDEKELSALVNFQDKTVVDIGSGTGKQALIALSGGAKTVFSVEPVQNLRYYVTEKVNKLGFHNFYALDGLITRIPLPDNSADIVMEGHVFGDHPEEELAEMERVTRPSGMIIHIPGNNDVDNNLHQIFLTHGYNWDSFAEPGDGIKRKYWKVKQ